VDFFKKEAADRYPLTFQATGRKARWCQGDSTPSLKKEGCFFYFGGMVSKQSGLEEVN
jgi:hypothetical protein